MRTRMRVGVRLTIRNTIVAGLVLVGLAALAPSASATGATSDACSSAALEVDRVALSTVAQRNILLTSDGTGFFSKGLNTIAVRSGHGGTEGVDYAASAVAQDLTDFYFGTNVEVVANRPGTSTRAVRIDGDTAVPGQPRVFTVGGVPTLFLHWTTAQADLATLLDVPTFTSHQGATPPPSQATTCDPESESAPWPAEPSTTLAYVDNTEPSHRAPLVPIGDTAPTATWPIGVTAAAVLVATGGVVLNRRDQLWSDRYAARTSPAASLVAASKPKYPVADLPPTHPRVIFLDNKNANGPDAAPQSPPTQREIDLHARTSESALASLLTKVAAPTDGPVLEREEFARAVNLEWTRHQNGGSNGAVASLVLSELDAVRLRLGRHAADELFEQVSQAIAELCRPLDVLGAADTDELAILMPDLDEGEARQALDDITRAIAGRTFTTHGERVLLTPATGFALLSDTKSAPELMQAVESARALSMMNLHLDPERWDQSATVLHGSTATRASTWTGVKEKLRTPFQIAITVVIAWVLPFLTYVALDSVGLDISSFVYIFVVVALVVTGAFILAEGVMATKQKEPPEVPTTPYPKATALIAAYMPNEAATVIETIDAFLAMDYPNELQIILAYNTPDPLPVEEHLDRIAAEHPNFVPVRIVGSNSKAQNVNAALSMAEGEFIGMFDADHQPRPDAFTRAWRWIDDGYDVVQGHCLTRNGDAGWLAKMIAVEFEAIYAVAHPGRAKMHRFGVFGGSNGFWRTKLLHETRMRGSMLTEDIDSSMRVVERGFKIRSDRDLVSRELATTTFKQVWNQRMRWAQGWFQVSLEHVRFAFTARELSIRQKMGIFHLLMWREVYPWLSQQLFPLLAFWALQAGGLGRLDWTMPIFVATSIFTFSVGPLQTLFAYRLADPEIKQHKKWFWGYLLFTTPFYTEYKNLIARVAHVKQFMGESNWRVTPRSSDPVPGPGGE